MQVLGFLWAIGLSVLSNRVFALPYGCGGTLGVVNVTKGGFDGLIWTCSGIDPGYRSLYASGQNTLWGTTEQTNATNCANYCSGWYRNGLNAGVYYPNSTCQCWTYGDINTGPSAATATSQNATFLDFYETGNTYGPPAAVDWGVFTCPAGAYRTYVGERGGFYGACYPLTIEPGQKALADCSSSGYHWEIWTKVNGFNVVTCYATLALAKVSVNFSSPYTLVDIYDFTTQTSTSNTRTITKSTLTSTSKKTTTTSATKETTTSKTSSSKKTTIASTTKTAATTTKRPTTTTSTSKSTSTSKKTSTSKTTSSK
ncbi:hypothetical protein F4859DRAFT_515089 [Xylaria cf. heliscus]|nr:hypothetical protein F4859DRAFT_515089 [Xylaria cf. heliscus]